MASDLAPPSYEHLQLSWGGPLNYQFTIHLPAAVELMAEMNQVLRVQGGDRRSYFFHHDDHEEDDNDDELPDLEPA